MTQSNVWSITKVLIGLGVSGGLGYLATRGLDWDLVLKSLASTSYSLVFLALVVFMGANYLRAYRWQLLFVDENISVHRLFVVQNEGIGINNVMPIRIASEATQLAVLTIRDKIDAAKSLATLGMERVVDAVASTSILVIAFLLMPELDSFALYVWGAAGFTLFVVVLVHIVAWSGESLAWVRKIRFLVSFSAAVKDLENQKLRLAASLFLSVLYWLLIGVTAWIIAIAIKLPISPTTATLVIIGTIFFATAVPAAPSAIGTYEWAIISILSILGVNEEAGFGFALITHAVFFLPPTIIAAVFLPREGIVTFRGVKMVMTRVASVGQNTGS